MMAKKPKKNESQNSAEHDGAKESSFKLPAWAQLLIFVTASTWIGLFAFMIYGFNSCIEMAHQASNPIYIAKNTEKIVHFKNGLPADFQYQFIANAAQRNTKVVTISYKPDLTSFCLIRAEQEEGKSLSAKEITNNFADGLQGFSNPIKVDQNGSLNIADQTLEYEVGTTSEKSQEGSGIFIGTVILKDKSSFTIFGITPPQGNNEISRFNMEALNKLIAAIGGF